MRIRIIRQPTGQVDGIDLGRFHIGATYDVGTTLANYLIADRLAVPLADTRPVLVIPLDHPIAERLSPRAEADDHSPRKKR